MDNLQINKKLLPLELTVLRFLKQHQLEGRQLVVAVSGGADSLSLLHCLWRLRAAAKIKVTAAHIHHGKASPAQKKYRDQALKFVQNFCARREIPLLTNELFAKKILKSENELRDFRHARLQEFIAQMPGAILCLAHHQDDLVETQLLRLIRGTGLAGLQGFASAGHGVIRPYVGEGQFRKSDILKYLRTMKVRFLKDPSNDKTMPLRNWLRQKWLAPLEQREPGLYSSLARSLQHLAEASHRHALPLGLIKDGRIDHGAFLTLTSDAKSALLAQYMREQNIQGYGASHVKEIMKRLDSDRSEHNFRLLRRNWYVNAEHIFCDASGSHDTLKSES